MRFINFFLTLIIITSCISTDENQPKIRNTVDINDVTKVIFTADKLELENDYFMSFHSFLQANESGLYVTPNNAVNDTVLFKLPSDLFGNKNSKRLRGAIREGNGPNELLNISLSTQTASDTLIFYSINSSAYLSIDSSGNITEKKGTPINVFSSGSSLGYNNGHFLFPSFHSVYSKDNLLTITNTALNTQVHFFEPRVPAGYEPAIRNQVFPIGSLPNGFAFSFLGDRKVYTIDFKGSIESVIVLGESDPIPEPFKISESSRPPGAKPYITKIEFFRDHLFILMDNYIWVLDYPDLELKNVFEFKKNLEDDKAPVIDFTINNDLLFLRIGRDGLFSINTNQNWFN